MVWFSWKPCVNQMMFVGTFSKPLNSPDVHRTSVKGLPLKIGKGCQRWYKCYNDIVWIHTPPPSNSSKYRFSSGFLTNVILLVTASEWRVNPKVLSKAKGPFGTRKQIFPATGPNDMEPLNSACWKLKLEIYICMTWALGRWVNEVLLYDLLICI